MTKKSVQKKQADERRWLVKGEHGETFGPADFETLEEWAKDGRLSPASVVSENGKAWPPANSLPGLGMDWVAEVSPGAFYGPIHRQALEGLMKDGTIAPTAALFVRDAACAGDARAEEAEKALAVCVGQAEQAQKWLTMQVAQLTAQLAERDARLQRLEQQAADANILQLLTQQIISAQEMAAQQILDAVADAQTKTAESITQELADGRQIMLGAITDTQEEIAARAVRDISAKLPPPKTDHTADAQSKKAAEKIEQAVRDAAATLVHDIKAGQAQLAAAMGDTAAALTRQVQRLSDEVQDVKAALAEERKAPARPAAPEVERFYVEAEAVEVIPPPAPQEPHHAPKPKHAKPHTPAKAAHQEPEAKGAQGLSMADIEQQARRELERLGAQGVNLFKRKK